jgi:hypothetical protein
MRGKGGSCGISRPVHTSLNKLWRYNAIFNQWHYNDVYGRPLRYPHSFCSKELSPQGSAWPRIEPGTYPAAGDTLTNSDLYSKWQRMELGVLPVVFVILYKVRIIRGSKRGHSLSRAKYGFLTFYSPYSPEWLDLFRARPSRLTCLVFTFFTWGSASYMAWSTSYILYRIGTPVLCKYILYSMLWICIVFNADPDSGSQPNADPDPGQTLKTQKVEFLHKNYSCFK